MKDTKSNKIIDDLIERSDCLKQSGHSAAAVEILSIGLKYAPQERRLYYALTEILLEEEHYQQALDTVEALPSVGFDLRTAELKAECLERLQRFEDAASIVNQVLAFDQNSASALNLKGLLFFQRRDLQGAEHLFERSIKSDPLDGKACINLGLLKLEAGDSHEGLEIIYQGFILSPHVKEVANKFHEVISTLRAFDEAEPRFRDACRRYPLNKRLAYLLIDILIQQNKSQEAMATIESCMANFGIDDGILNPALKIRADLGPMEINPKKLQNGSISLCMIIKNEKNHLAKCLESAKKVVDEMVVVDTGSSDRSADIAKAFGANVYAFDWHNDFSNARNFSLSKANGQWIFILDADEMISGRNCEQLLNTIEQGDKGSLAYRFITRNYTNDVGNENWQSNNNEFQQEHAGKGWYPSEKVRLFPNDGRICFENAVHELVEPSLRRHSIPIKYCSVPIHHYGTLNRKKEAKKKANYYTLGKEKIAENRADPSALVEHAIQAQEVGDYKAALNLWGKVLEHCPKLPKAYFNLSYVYIQLEQYNQGLESACQAMELDPDLKEAVLNFALCQIRIGEIKPAIKQLKIFLGTAPQHPMGSGLLAVAYCILGQKDQGLELFDEIHRMGFNCPEYIIEHAQKLNSVGHRQEAIALLEAIVESHYANEKIRLMLSELTRYQVESPPLNIRFLNLNGVNSLFAPHIKLLEEYRNLDQQFFVPVENEKHADFILFPFNIDRLYHRLGYEEFRRFLRQLPYFAEHEHKFVFFVQDDIDSSLDITSVIYRVNHDKRKVDVNSITLPYFIDDIYQASMSEKPRYHVNFVGTIVTHVLRAYMLLPFLGKTNLPLYNTILEKLDALLANRKNDVIYKALLTEAVSYIQQLFPLTQSLQGVNYFFDISVEQFHKFTENVQKAKKDQLVDIMSQSEATLCPRGFGAQSIRFFETLSAGRIPVMISDNYILPLEGHIDYASFIWNIDESKILKLPNEISILYNSSSVDEIHERGAKARRAWLDYFASAKRSKYIYATLSEVLKRSYRLNKT